MTIREYSLYLTIFIGVVLAVFLSAKTAQADHELFSCIRPQYSDDFCSPPPTLINESCSATNISDTCHAFASGGSFQIVCNQCLSNCDHTTRHCIPTPTPTLTPGACRGNIVFSSILPNPAATGEPVTAIANNLQDCGGKEIIFKIDSCDDASFRINSCTVVNGTGCSIGFSAPTNPIRVLACIDKNDPPNGFNDSGEKSNVLNLNISGAPPLPTPTATPVPPTAAPTAVPPTAGPGTIAPTAPPPTPTPVPGSWGGVQCLKDGVATLDCLPAVLKLVIQSLLMFAGIVAVYLMVHSGSKFILSSGDPKRVEEARNTLVYAIFGLIIVLAAFLIVNLVSHVTGVSCLRNIGFICL